MGAPEEDLDENYKKDPTPKKDDEKPAEPEQKEAS